MVVAQMVVDSVVLDSIRATAKRYGVSKSWVHELVRRSRSGGADALAPGSKAPRTNARSISVELEELIVALRKDLHDIGADAGAETIRFHLDKMPAGTLINQPHHRIRHDVVDVRGHVSLRYLGKLRHLNVGWAIEASASGSTSSTTMSTS